MASRWLLAALLLVANVTALHSPHYILRKRLPNNCGFAHYGSAVGSAQRLVETHLAPGVADWNIIVPMPPPCADAQVMGADMRVCDADAPPEVAMSDTRLARVHRAGQLAGFATVNVTVYCILPSPPTPAPQTPPLAPLSPHLRAPQLPPLPLPPTPTNIAPPLSHLTDSMLSNELISKEVTSNEETSNELESNDLKSIALTTTVKPTSSTTLPPTQEETTTQVELTPTTEVVTALPNNMTRPKEKTPQSLKVTINIIPTNQVSTEEDHLSQSYGVELPLLSNKEKPNEVMSSHSPSFSSVPYVELPPRIFAMPPWIHIKQPQGPGSPALAAASHRSPGARLPLRPPHYPRGPQHSTLPSPYDLMPPYSLAPVYRTLSLLSPRLAFLQRRQPLLFFRHF